MKRVLFVSYVFPPAGGAGVQRTVKFAKYLPRHDWEVSILTALNPSVPILDLSLSGDVPEGTIVERARTYEPSYATKAKVSGGAATIGGFSVASGIKQALRASAIALLQPDPQILWAPNAIRIGTRLLRRMEHCAIFATAPPFSSFIIGAFLSRRFKLPLILDYRDEWDISNAHWENRSDGGLSMRWQRRQQARLLRRASAIVATTQSSANSIENTARQAGSTAAVSCIYNGYDPDDFRSQSPHWRRDSHEVFRILYTGTLWQLTTISPLVEAIVLLHKRRPDLAQRIELCVYGRRTSDQDALITQLSATQCKVVVRDYVPHKDIIPLMSDADSLCVLLADSDDAARVVPAKVFEYMAARRPIIAIAPRGEVWNLLDKFPRAVCCAPQDIEGVAKALTDAICARPEARDQNDIDVKQYSRENHAKQLADILNKLT